MVSFDLRSNIPWLPLIHLICFMLTELALVLNTFGKFCLEGDEAEEVQEEAQVRSLVKRLVEQRVEKEEQDLSSDFDD